VGRGRQASWSSVPPGSERSRPDRAAASLANLTTTPQTVVQSPDSFALVLAARRATQYDEVQRIAY
jgi:hypothetical protein